MPVAWTLPVPAPITIALFVVLALFTRSTVPALAVIAPTVKVFATSVLCGFIVTEVPVAFTIPVRFPPLTETLSFVFTFAIEGTQAAHVLKLMLPLAPAEITPEAPFEITIVSALPAVVYWLVILTTPPEPPVAVMLPPT